MPGLDQGDFTEGHELDRKVASAAGDDLGDDCLRRKQSGELRAVAL
jgi:hypothetical protein